MIQPSSIKIKNQDKPLAVERNEKKSFTLIPVQVLKLLYWVIFVLSSISLAVTFIKYVIPPEKSNTINILTSFFYLDRESNIPTYFASTFLLVAALLLAFIFIYKKIQKDHFRFYWAILSVAFFAMSIDEYMSFHELLSEPLQEKTALPSLFYYAWVIPGIALVTITGLLFFKFILHLNKRTRRQFLLAAMLFFGGAIGFELIGGVITVHYGKETFLYAFISHIEEILEMTGVSYFIYALLTYLKTLKPMTIQVFRPKKD